MQILLDNILDASRLDAIVETLEEEADSLFEDGKKTAGRTAKKVKSNLQARPDAVEIKGAAAMVEKALLANPVFAAAAFPKRIAKIMFSRYDPDMEYGAHVDDPIIADTRTDISFTLFLSDPDSYEGGELVLHKYDGDESIKLPAGSLVFYPSTSVHSVARVLSGQRLAAVGWVESHVRLVEHREILFDLHNALANLADTEENRLARISLLKAKYNLMRQWFDS